MKSALTRPAWLLAFGVGFLSLSEEILWVRVVSFMGHGVPQAFAFVLAMFLLGVALGASLGRRACHASPSDTLRSAIVLLVLSSLITLSLPSLIGEVGESSFRWLVVGSLITASAAAKATLFPIAHHLGSEIGTGRIGRTVSRVYFFNIAGSTLGPIVTGFVLMDYFSVGALFLLLGASGLVLSSVVATWLSPRWLLVGPAIVMSAWVAIDRDDHSMIVALVDGTVPGEVVQVVENRHGILHVVRDGGAGDIVYGGNVYDGRTNLDLVANSNRIDRLYLLAALHREPARILVIGLSSGAWTRVLAEFPTVERIDVVEINPGYLQVIRNYPDIAPILHDPRIHIHIDDGRRWLRRHPDLRFDLIVMNTTYHWRAYSTNLLAVDFLAMARQHLEPGGLITYNATGSPDALYTATQAFPHAYRWSNFVYAANWDFRDLNWPGARDQVLGVARAFSTRDDPALGTVPHAVDELLATPFVDVESVASEAGRPLETVTVQNMITEYRYGRRLLED
jgi:spermidine synthase